MAKRLWHIKGTIPRCGTVITPCGRQWQHEFAGDVTIVAIDACMGMRVLGRSVVMYPNRITFYSSREFVIYNLVIWPRHQPWLFVATSIFT